MREVEKGKKGWEGSTAEASETRCTTCMSSIPKGARVCLHCKAFQKQWPNRLTFFAKISGALAIVGSLLVFTITKLPEVRKIVAWKDSVQVLYFDSNDSIVVSNTGDGDVLLQYVLLTSLSSGTYSVPINEAIEAKRILTHKYVRVNNTSGPENQPQGVYLIDGAEITPNERAKIATITVNANDPCYSLSLRLASDEGYLQVHEHYQKYHHADVMKIPYSAKLFYYSIKEKQSLVATFDVVAMVFKSSDPRCTKS